MKYIVAASVVVIAMFAYQKMKKAKAIRRKKEDAKKRAILQEILDSRR